MEQLNYLTALELATFGVPDATVDQITQACSLIDAYIGRPEGLLWVADATGLPVRMSRKNPEGDRTLTAPIAPGTNVVATLSPGPIMQQGSAVVLDALGAPETCRIIAVGQNTITLDVVTSPHVAGTTAQFGLLVEETVRIPKGRSVATLSRGPIVRLVSAMGRVSYTRRGASAHNTIVNDYGLQSAVSAFGGAPIWQLLSIMDSSIDVTSNKIWCPVGLMMVPYNEVRFSYIAGYSVASLPTHVKQAAAQVIKAMAESPAGASIKSFKAGDTQLERFMSSIVDSHIRDLLAPYVVKTYA